jgi:hypothetical protein
MLSGNGIPAHAKLPAVTGFSIAAGLHVSFTWGVDPLYAQLAAAFDAVIGFAPFRTAGILSVRGTLHLFIVDISAWAELDVAAGDDGQGGRIAQISGDVCGEVDFLFFSVSGCVHFSLGGAAVPIPDPPPLVKSLKLVSRSPALVVGTGVDKPIDSSLGNAVENDSDTNPGNLPVVPIDVVPALMLALPPLQDAALAFLGQPIGGTPDAPSDGWVQRGDVWFQYTITKIELVGPVTAGKTPATWWNTQAGDQALEAQLALLSWVPDPTPKALGSSKYLDEITTEKWGTVCAPAAPPTPVLWTFFFQILGPSDSGWSPFGLAYPDPPGTIRSSPPDLALRVTERWRCGDPLIDKLRGIVPAEIEGAAVACPTGKPPTSPQPGVLNADAAPHALTPVRINAATLSLTSMQRPTRTPGFASSAQSAVFNNPVSALRGNLSSASANQVILPFDTPTLAEVIQRFNAGQPVSRATLSSVVPVKSAPPVGAGATQPQCYGWALASPVFDDGQVIDLGDPSRKSAVENAWAAQEFKPGPLDDAIVFNFGPFEYARFYLWIPTRFRELKAVVVAASDAHDNFFDQHVIVAADRVPPGALPSSWTAAASPWEPAAFVLEELAATAASNYTAVFVQVKGGGGADRVQIGCPPSSRALRQKITLRPFIVGGIEALKTSEVLRSSYDTTEQTKKQGVLEDALGLDSADNALLEAAQAYEVKVTWSANRERRVPGNSPSDQKSVAGQVQSFWFQTDSSPPARLDPWVLVALPGEAEKHYFAAETVRVVFATNNVGLIYQAYGKKLQARLRPSSYVPVPSTAAVPHPFPLSVAHLVPVKASVLSPWEGSVQQIVMDTAPCVAISGERIRHSMVTIPIPLDLYTDYLIDIEMIDAGAEDGTPGTRVWRGSFSTGGFATAADFARSFQVNKVNHRGVHTDDLGKLQAIGPSFVSRAPQGDELDAALTTAGLPALPVPKQPGVTVFWDPDAPVPQPAALLVDASEPMWRDRPIPTQVTDPGPSASKRYELRSQPWLELAQGGGDDIVDFIVPAPGGQRALVTLKPGSRGKRIVLALKRVAHTEPYLDGSGATDQLYTILDMTLGTAPWEEES